MPRASTAPSRPSRRPRPEPDCPKVVADKEQRRVELLTQSRDQVDHHGLDGHVERGGGLVEQEQRGIGQHRHGDDHALLLTARDLVGVAPHHRFGVGHVDVAQHLQAALVGDPVGNAFVEDQHFLELGGDGQARVERAHRLLIDHGDLGAANPAQFLGRHACHVAALELDGALHDAAVGPQVAHDRHGDRRLAAAGFTDQAITLAPLELEREVGNRRDLADAGKVGDADVVDLEDVVFFLGHVVNPSSRFRAGRRPAG